MYRYRSLGNATLNHRARDTCGIAAGVRLEWQLLYQGGHPPVLVTNFRMQRADQAAGGVSMCSSMTTSRLRAAAQDRLQDRRRRQCRHADRHPVAGLCREQEGVLVSVRYDAGRAWLSRRLSAPQRERDRPQPAHHRSGPAHRKSYHEAPRVIRPFRRRQLRNDVSATADAVLHRYARRDDRRRYR